MKAPELHADPMPVAEEIEKRSDDAIALLSGDIHAPQDDAWSILFAALDRAIEAHKPICGDK